LIFEEIGRELSRVEVGVLGVAEGAAGEGVVVLGAGVVVVAGGGAEGSLGIVTRFSQ